MGRLKKEGICQIANGKMITDVVLAPAAVEYGTSITNKIE